jgi:4-hydroxy-tetrahydrodipicolinate synthase
MNWTGVFPAATTAFRTDESLDLEGSAKHFDVLVRAGVHGLVVLGSVGETHALSFDEKLDLLRAAKDVVKGRVPLVAGVAHTTTRDACRFAEKADVDGLMLLPATLYPSDPRETVAHFRSVARACGRPILCYNNPVAYGVDLTPRIFAELADEPNLEAIKESSNDPRRITDLVNELGDRYALMGGVDDLVLESVLLGARGWISGLTNAFPRESLTLWEYATSGRREEALRLYRWFTPLLHLDTHPKLVQYIKLAMAETGRGTETCRAPRLRLEGAERERILGIIRRAVANAPAR